MRMFFQKAYWILLCAGIAIAILLGTAIWGAVAGFGALACSFAWPRQSDDGLQRVCLAATMLFFIFAMFGGTAYSGLLWAGVALFGFLAVTAKMK